MRAEIYRFDARAGGGYRASASSSAPRSKATIRQGPAAEGTEVTVVCSGVPSGISAEDHAAGIASSLANLAAFVE